MDTPINKTMDRDDLLSPQSQAILREIRSLMSRMKANGVSYSSWFGSLERKRGLFERLNRGVDYEPWEDDFDDENIPWFLLWEICWLVSNTPIPEGAVVLDMGGASSLFSCYLASKGLEVHSIDLSETLVENGNRIAEKMGWKMRAQVMDMRRLRFGDAMFDCAFSVCVYEHIPYSDRLLINRNIKRLLKKGGKFSITFDYMNPNRLARIGTPRAVEAQFVTPTELGVVGNNTFFDNGVRYLQYPAYLAVSRKIALIQRLLAAARGEISMMAAVDSSRVGYTFGALFLENR